MLIPSNFITIDQCNKVLEKTFKILPFFSIVYSPFVIIENTFILLNPFAQPKTNLDHSPHSYNLGLAWMPLQLASKSTTFHSITQNNPTLVKI